MIIHNNISQNKTSSSCSEPVSIPSWAQAYYAGYAGVFFTLVLQNIFEAEYVNNPDDWNANFKGAAWVLAIGALMGLVEYCTAKYNHVNSLGFFSSHVAKVLDKADKKPSNSLDSNENALLIFRSK